MKSDRELLELAAKAAGIEYTISPHGNLLAHKHPGGGEMRVWNPLADDGDALRLAAKLRLDVEFAPAATWLGVKKDAPVPLTFQEHGPDEYAATRRAIVRAAAEFPVASSKKQA